MNGLPTLTAEPWSYALGVTGKAFIFLAIAACLATAVLSLLPRSERSVAWSQRSFYLGAFSFVAAFACLIVLFFTQQFQFEYVFKHSAKDHEAQYLFAGAWSGQEGSFLLWGLMSSIVGAIAARNAGVYRRWFTAVYGLFLAGLAGILAYESPFRLLTIEGKHVVPRDGMGLSASLLNYWVVIHPPTIFLGFGTLTVLFAYAFAAVLQRDLRSWIPLVRPWAVFVLAVLGLGLCMGGFWAYETLGWGGFWAWDPVENTSFVPWVAVVAFVHGLFVQQARQKWFFGNAIFAVLPFVLFCWGTLLTRSGWLGDTSVHSFAQMDKSALLLLISLSAVGLASFVVALAYNWSAIAETLPSPPEPQTAPINRGFLYGTGIWLLLFGFGLTTAIGMSIPAILRAFDEQPKVVPEGLYHQVLVWYFPLFMVAMAVAPFVSWRGIGFRALFSRVTNSLAVSVGLVGVILLWMKSPGFQAPGPDETIRFFDIGTKAIAVPKVTWVLFLTWLCLFVAVASFWRMMESLKRSRQTVGAMLAHFGFALALLGLVFSRGFEQKAEIMLHPSESPAAFGYALENKGQTSQFSDRNNKIEIRATSRTGSFTAMPGMYVFFGRDGQPNIMKWPSIVNRGLFDYYFTVYDPNFDATDWTSFVLSDDPVENPDMKVHRDIGLMYTGYEVEGSIAEDGQSTLTAKMAAIMDGQTYELEPKVIVRRGGQPEMVEARIGDKYRLYLGTMDFETHAIQVKLEYVEPAYPLEVYFKPLTLFVWLGVGIMTLGGLYSAALRRKERLAGAQPESDDTEADP